MKKTINWIMALMLLVQLVMPGLVAWAADDRDWQEFSLVTEINESPVVNACELGNDKKSAYPSLSLMQMILLDI